MGETEPIPKPEVVKRLTPTGDTLRELFLKSGNLCAFPGCHHLMMDPEGNFIGQVCHIEAAEEGGERFNANQTNDERRQLSNLVMLCYEHHTVTNNVDEFSVPRMQELKRNHENKVNDFATQLQFRVADLTKRQVPRPSSSPKKLASALEWDFGDVELQETAAQLNALLERLREIPRQAREILVVAVERSSDKGMFGRRYFSPEEVDLACGLPAETTRPLWGILDRYKIAWYLGRHDETGIVQFVLSAPGCEWDAWGDLLRFQKNTPGALHEMIVDLNFSILD